MDKHVYVKMFGYRDTADYYEQISLDKVIKNIQVPTFAFGAIDDQVCDHKVVPMAEIESEGSQVFLSSSAHGGHVMHVIGSYRPQVWYAEPCMEFLNFMHKKLPKANPTAK